MTELHETAVPVRRESASLSRLSPIEGVMVAFDAGVYVKLNESAMLIWELIDGRRSIREIATHLGTHFSLAETGALQDTRECLMRFVELQIIDV